MNAITTSVVVPAYNCEDIISQCIESIINQSYPVDEIIIVDDGSIDRTAQVIKKYKQVKYIFQENQGPAIARNHGAAISTGEIVFFTDSDCQAESTWIEKSVSHFSDEIAVVAGSYGISNAESLLARCIYKEILFRHHKLMPKFPKAFGSYNFAIKRSVFNDVGGFNESYRHASGEDNDLSYKIIQAGYKIIFEPYSIVKHYHPTRISKYLVEQFRHGYWRVKMYKDHPRMMAGDDYTFWKDIAEIPIAFFILIFLIGALIKINFVLEIFCVLIFILLAIEFYYSYVTLKIFLEAIFFSLILFVRAFARAIGFSTGIIKMSSQFGLKKVK